MKRTANLMILLPAALLACLFSRCANDNIPEKGGSEGEVFVQFALSMPYTGERGTTRGINTNDESRIDEIDVLAYVQNGSGDWVYEYSGLNVRIDDTEGGNINERTVTATVKAMGVNQRFVILANCFTELKTANPVRGETMANIEERIICSTGGGEWPVDGGGFVPFPMYAITDANVVDHDANRIGTYPMIRMVARIDVALATTVKNFVLKEACLFNYKTAGYVSYINSNFDDNSNKAITPAVPAEGDHTGTPVLHPNVCYQAGGSGEIRNSIYTFESEAITNEEDKTKKTALVIGGIYESSPTMTYYRIDLKDNTDLSNNISSGILRNHLYNVEVQSVAGEGYSKAIDAYLGDARLTAMVRPWDLAKQDVIGDGMYYLDVEMDTDGVFRRWVNGSTLTTVKAKTDYDIDYRGFPVGIQISGIDYYNPQVAPANEWLTLTHASGQSDGELIREFTLEVDRLKVPQNVYAVYAKINVTAGNFTKVINISYVNECYPEPHKGWAGSNIYWDGSKLTFDDVGVTTHEQYQGLHFQWGSLYGISPKDNWSDSTKIYTPEGTLKTTSSMGLSLLWDTSPWMPRVSDGTILNYRPASLGKTDRDRAYLHELSAANGDLDDTGDICKHLTEQGWAPPGKWRMPTSNEFGDKTDYLNWEAYTITTEIFPEGTTKIPTGLRKGATPPVFFPASGSRVLNPVNLNFVALYWSGSPREQFSYNLTLAKNSVNTIDFASRKCCYSVRCVKE